MEATLLIPLNDVRSAGDEFSYPIALSVVAVDGAVEAAAIERFRSGSTGMRVEPGSQTVVRTRARRLRSHELDQLFSWAVDNIVGARLAVAGGNEDRVDLVYSAPVPVRARVPIGDRRLAIAVSFLSTVTDPIALVRERVDLRRLLLKHFARFAQSVAVGTSAADVIDAIERQLVTDPPKAPGLALDVTHVQLTSGRQPQFGLEVLVDLPSSYPGVPIGFVPASQARLVRDAWGSVYVSGTNGEDILEALLELATEVYGDVILDPNDPILGSWWQRFKLLLLHARDMPVVQERLAELDKRISIEAVERSAAEVDNLKADSLHKLLDGLQGQDEAVIVLGQLIVLKFEGRIVSRTVTPMMAKELESRPNLLTSPRALLSHIEIVQATAEMQEFAQRELPGPPERPGIEGPDA